jgi:DNA segregation ATPase FtsK/SpoIIIE-like protein
VVLTPVAPPVPQTPNWPAFDKPAEASVVWDSHGLAIDAANSSLEQILKDVSTATGAKVEGLSADQRVFGAYGPGQARDVLSQLLQGSGYNVIMIGDQGQGAPRQILLSVRQAGPIQPAARTSSSGNDEDDAEDQQPAPQEPISNRPGFPPGAPPRSPQQIMQEMQQRQQQLQQQQQQQPANAPN